MVKYTSNAKRQRLFWNLTVMSGNSESGRGPGNNVNVEPSCLNGTEADID